MLAGLLVAAKKPDYATAFDLVTESARQGDVDGEKLLARLYREGKGTPADLAKAQLWERRAADAQSLAMVKQAMTPGNIGTAIKSFWETFGGQLDFDLSMMPQNCFSRDVLNQGNPKVPCR
jgi:TPR repeat protein